MKTPAFVTSTFLVLIFCCTFSDVIYGQSASDTGVAVFKEKDLVQNKGIKSPDDLLKDFEKMENERKNRQELTANLSDAMLADNSLDSAKKEAWKDYYQYMSHGYQHRANVFRWQLISSIIIFFMVNGLVFIGIYFAWLQFKMALKEMEKGKEENLVTELNVSPKEIKVSSPVLGIIILVISLVFFYLYLVYIFPIEEIF